MAMSGVELDQECKKIYDEVQSKKKHRYVTFKIDDGKIRVDKVRFEKKFFAKIRFYFMYFLEFILILIEIYYIHTLWKKMCKYVLHFKKVWKYYVNMTHGFVWLSFVYFITIKVTIKNLVLSKLKSVIIQVFLFSKMIKRSIIVPKKFSNCIVGTNQKKKFPIYFCKLCIFGRY